MKPRMLLATACLATLPAAIDAETPSAPPPAPAPIAWFVNADAPEFAEIRALGERAINRIGYSMLTEVASTVAKSGPVDALSACHLKALPATGEIVPGMPRITAVKRTSLRLRDPANTPDPADLAALERVRAALEAGDAPPVFLIQRVERPGGLSDWRVYRPLANAPQCITCHGKRAEMTPELCDEIARRYPYDEAFDYTVGSWRGLVRVSISNDPPPASAKKS